MENQELINTIAKELQIGKAVTKQLQMYIKESSCTLETNEILVNQISSSFENSLSLLNFNSCSAKNTVLYPARVVAGTSDSPTSLSRSSRSEEPKNDSSRSRKSTRTWKKQVKVSPGMGLEGPLDDGFSWRKYGQKHILGSKYPRGYYRCTDRLVEGCLATKQIQRSDEDSTIFEITYHGNHTCTQNSQICSPYSQPPENQEPRHPHHIHHQQHPSQQLFLNFRSGHNVITQDLDQSSTRIPSASNNIVEPNQNQMFSTNDSIIADCLMANFSDSMTGHRLFDEQHISTAAGVSLIEESYNTSVRDYAGPSLAAADSPNVGLDFEFDPNFTFDNSGFQL